MSKNISVPDIGDFKDVEIIEVLVKPGDQVKKNDPIVTLESDKSSVEVPSTFEGIIENIKVKDIINYNPVSVESDRDINYMLKTIQNHEFLISFIPIIDNRKIRGSITFFNLINSES